ncbi:MAG TPA: TatD family deoxyribonuclease [Ruminiclostridium sp.]|jgi:TatD DNase family protein|uniref:Hydrolase TatD n=1 Tax=Acetivibrio saccincola TaxID=1677857 RepID=A0A2K9E543_9FIRM|nr:TatD family hydrolase [Acetivibrio saccincola]HAA43260.1 TatD family deoxyribonuclease [Ruminiclostridium sp.]AUG58817.1 putative deoxyribonuclease YcfH [Acetivibrio saccincola]NLW25854.1 TatD family hydrolase [Acetivibrio saccincola]PQQ66084.1 hydrolase TatD [Acetivibrio saccincola]HOA96297.1 TatD family hydrolase [Acetivibrio saccincola]
MFFDSHAHYDDRRFDNDREEIIKDAFNNGVSYILNASSSRKSVAETVSLANEFEKIYAAVGIHPHDAKDMDEDFLEELKNYAKNPKVVAVGEIGLDYHYDFSPRDTQKFWFKRQINLAKELKLPIIIHDREAHKDVLDIVKSEKAGEVGGVFHCFSGSVEMAREVLNNNFYISLAGPVTFKNARKAAEVAEYVPIDRLLIETDCPYLTPEPYRGKRNYSAYVKYVAEKIAEIKGMELEEVAEKTTANAKKLFKIRKG